MRFDSSLNWNVLVTIVTVLLGGGAMYATNNANLAATNKRIDTIEASSKAFEADIKKDISLAGDKFDGDHERLIRIEESIKAIAETLRLQRNKP